MKLREFEEADFAALTALWHRTNLATYSYIPAHQAHTLAQARNFFRDEVLANNRVWVAVLPSGLAGLIAVNATHITQFAVAPEFQRQGIGSALLVRVLERHHGDLCLFTFQRNEAGRRFYERRGFFAVAFGVSPAPESEPDVEYRYRGT